MHWQTVLELAVDFFPKVGNELPRHSFIGHLCGSQSTVMVVGVTLSAPFYSIQSEEEEDELRSLWGGWSE